MKYTHAIMSLVLLLFAGQAFAVNCKIIVAKNTCWNNYEIKVRMLDALTLKEYAVIDVPKGQHYTVKEMQCESGKQVFFRASFKPVIWQNQKGDFYQTKRFWDVPQALVKDAKHWEVKLCFPRDFDNVPIPPGDLHDCQCKFPLTEGKVIKSHGSHAE